MSKKKSSSPLQQVQELYAQIKSIAHKAKKDVESELGLEIWTENESEYNDQDYFTIAKLTAVGTIPIHCSLSDLECLEKTEIDEMEAVIKKLTKDTDKNKDLVEDLSILQKSIIALCVKTKRKPSDILDLLINYLAISEMAN